MVRLTFGQRLSWVINLSSRAAPGDEEIGKVFAAGRAVFSETLDHMDAAEKAHEEALTTGDWTESDKIEHLISLCELDTECEPGCPCCEWFDDDD